MQILRNTALAMVVALAAMLAAPPVAGAAQVEADAARDRPLFRAGAAPLPQSEPAARGSDGSLSGGRERGALSELVPTGIALGATLLVIVLTRSAIKRFGPGAAAGKRPQGVVEILARYPVARGQQIVLLKVGRRVIVAHQGAQGMQSLSEFTGEAEVADLLARCEAGSRSASPFSFDALLRQSSRSEPRREAREHLPASVRDAEIETVDLTRRRRGSGAA